MQQGANYLAVTTGALDGSVIPCTLQAFWLYLYLLSVGENITGHNNLYKQFSDNCFTWRCLYMNDLLYFYKPLSISFTDVSNSDAKIIKMFIQYPQSKLMLIGQPKRSRFDELVEY